MVEFYEEGVIQLKRLLYELMQCGGPQRPGPTVGNVVQRETVALMGPMTPKAKSLQIGNNRLSTLVTVSRIHSYSKTGNLNVMYNCPPPGEQ